MEYGSIPLASANIFLIEKMNNYNPLVSVFIVTYNSSDNIIDALDSVKSQTYQNIELIVSDDCSSDNTRELVKEWFLDNGDRFVRSELVETPVNTGTSANYNRAVRACKGEWLKMLDGDDMLLPDCIEKNIQFVSDESNAEVVFSDVQNFKISKGEIIILNKFFTKDHEIFFSLESEQQLKMLLKNNILPSVSCFIKASLLKKYRYDEKYYCLEDSPMWFALLVNGIQFYGFNDITAMYRIGESTMRGQGVYFKRMYLDMYIQYFWDVKIKLCRKYNLQDAYNVTRKYILQVELADMLLHNKRTRINDVLYFVIRLFIKLTPKYKL